MIQTLLLLLAPAQEAPELSSAVNRPLHLMATRLPACGTQQRHARWRQIVLQAAKVAGNACGFALFLAVLGLLLRLAEQSLH